MAVGEPIPAKVPRPLYGDHTETAFYKGKQELVEELLTIDNLPESVKEIIL